MRFCGLIAWKMTNVAADADYLIRAKKAEDVPLHDRLRLLSREDIEPAP